jgi:hypothetical protein
MPLDRFVLILVVVVCAAGATVWLLALAAGALAFPLGWLALIPAGIAAFVLWRVIADRMAEPDTYERMEGDE